MDRRASKSTQRRPFNRSRGYADVNIIAIAPYCARSARRRRIRRSRLLDLLYDRSVNRNRRLIRRVRDVDARAWDYDFGGLKAAPVLTAIPVPDAGDRIGSPSPQRDRIRRKIVDARNRSAASTTRDRQFAADNHLAVAGDIGIRFALRRRSAQNHCSAGGEPNGFLVKADIAWRGGGARRAKRQLGRLIRAHRHEVPQLRVGRRLRGTGAHHPYKDHLELQRSDHMPLVYRGTTLQDFAFFRSMAGHTDIGMEFVQTASALRSR